MNEERPPIPTDPRAKVDTELERWRRVYAGETFFYGEEPGPIARRAVRYHRAFMPQGGTALDAGCGEGQDLAFLVERGYRATGLEFTPEGARKSRLFLDRRGLQAEVLQQDIRSLDRSLRFDLVLAVNSLQFMGTDGPAGLEALKEATRPGGAIGISFFGREPGEPEFRDTLWFTTLEEVLAGFREWQPLEAARLWQWNVQTNTPQAFVTLIARKTPPTRLGVGR